MKNNKLKCWKKQPIPRVFGGGRYGGRIWYNEKKDVSVIVQDQTNIVMIENWGKNKHQETGPAPTKEKAIAWAQKYMEEHDTC